jgi:transcriptional regulator with XRE-family HTH domain
MNKSVKYSTQSEQGARLARLLEEKKINQKHLAKQAQISESGISAMKRGSPINDRLIKAILLREDLGTNAIEWIFFGKYEDVLFGGAEIPSQDHASPPGSTISEQAIAPYTINQEKAFQELRSIIDDPVLALKITKAMNFICAHDEQECRKILKDVLGVYDLLRYEQEKKSNKLGIF